MQKAAKTFLPEEDGWVSDSLQRWVPGKAENRTVYAKNRCKFVPYGTRQACRPTLHFKVKNTKNWLTGEFSDAWREDLTAAVGSTEPSRPDKAIFAWKSFESSESTVGYDKIRATEQISNFREF